MLKIYDINKSNSARFSLGDRLGKTLYVFGVNPSTASNVKLDPTLKNVEAFSRILGFDSFIMFNLYPQRSTDPNGLHQRRNTALIQRNIEVIRSHLEFRPTIWAAWGNLIDKRSYLYPCLEQINEALREFHPSWIMFDKPTKQGHPPHPSRKKHEDRFVSFNIEEYLEGFSSAKKRRDAA